MLRVWSRLRGVSRENIPITLRPPSPRCGRGKGETRLSALTTHISRLTSHDSLLADPLTAAADGPHPGGRVGAGDGVEDVLVGVGGTRPGAGEELQEAVGAACLVD